MPETETAVRPAILAIARFLHRLLLPFRRPEPLPRSIVLRHIQRLQGCPGPDRLLSCGALLRSHEVAHEVDVSPVGNVRKWSCSLTQSNVFSHQISVGDLDTIGDPIFPPTIEPVARARLSLQTRREFESLSLKKVFGFLVVGVDHDSKVETQTSVDVFNSGLRKASLGRALNPAGLEKDLDSPFELVFAQLVRGWDPDPLRKVLELDRVPIAIVKLSRRHRPGQLRLQFQEALHHRGEHTSLTLSDTASPSQRQKSPGRCNAGLRI